MSEHRDLPSRDEALALLVEFTTKRGLLQHAFAVEAAMRAHARRLDQDAHAFGLAGLLHDFDYERFPSAEDHPARGSEILRERGYPDWFRRAILSHAPHTGVVPETDLERCLFAVDELCGFVAACCLVRPDRSIVGLEVRSVRKRMKSKAFAKGVDREHIVEGAAEIGMELDAHIAFTIEAMRRVSDAIGLGGDRTGDGAGGESDRP